MLFNTYCTTCTYYGFIVASILARPVMANENQTFASPVTANNLKPLAKCRHTFSTFFREARIINVASLTAGQRVQLDVTAQGSAAFISVSYSRLLQTLSNKQDMAS